MNTYGILGLLVSILLGLTKGSDDVTTTAPPSENNNEDTNDRPEVNIFQIFALVHQLNQEIVLKQIALASCQREMVDLEEASNSDSPEPAVNSIVMPLEMSESVPDQIPATPLEVGVPIQMPSGVLMNSQQQSNVDESVVEGVDIPVQLPEQDNGIDTSLVDDQPIQLPSVPVEVVTAEGTIQNEIGKRHEGMPRMFGLIINSLVRRFMFYDESVTQCETAVSQFQNQELATMSPEVTTHSTASTVTISETSSTLTTAP